MDGRFDLVVEGGGGVVIEIAHPAFIPAQRTVAIEWSERLFLDDDVALVPYDDAVTEVSLDGSATAIQIARGTPQSDTDGTRTATLLFAPGTSAELRMPDGTTRALGTAHVRATELTVGERGAEAMPSTLPASSAYTYAVELSMDEAVAAGASEVRFSSPVAFYFENFLGMPVGTDIPIGYYDRERAVWIGAEPGRVVRVVSTAGGTATIDSDGDGAADDSLAIGADEARAVASLYAEGTTLWRSTVEHFTPWDHNFPFGIPGDANGPGEGIASARSDRDCDNEGSIVGCLNQSLGEMLPIAGTPYALAHGSMQEPGYRPSRRIRVAVAPTTLFESLVGSRVRIDVAGLRETREYTRDELRETPELDWAWDGRDGAGRALHGIWRARVQVCFDVRGEYRGTRDFAEPGIAPIPVYSRNEIRLCRTSWTTLSADVRPTAEASIGGWTLAGMPRIDASRDAVWIDGRPIELSPVVTPLAGDCFDGSARAADDGLPATSVRLGPVSRVAIAPDGTIYFWGLRQPSIRTVDRNGILGSVRYVNEDDPLGRTRVVTDGSQFTLDRDGRLLFFQDTGTLWRLDPDGIARRLAGGGAAATGAATSVLVRTGPVVAGLDGSIFISQRVTGAETTIRVLRPSGLVSEFAGRTGTASAALRVPAREQFLGTRPTLGISPDGSLWTADVSGYRIGPDGVAERVIGTGGAARTLAPGDVASTGTVGSGGARVLRDPQLDSAGTLHYSSASEITTVTADGRYWPVPTPPGFNVEAHHIAPDGALFLALRDPATSQYCIVRQETRPSRIRVDGRTFLVDAQARVSEERDTLTDAPIRRVHYTAEGALDAIEEVGFGTTRVVRGTSGQPEAIVSPHGHRTQLVLDAAGYLDQLTAPNGARWDVDHGADGLLVRFVDPLEREHVYAYEPDGRLRFDRGAGPMPSTLTLREEPRVSGRAVTVTTAEGFSTTHAFEVGSRGRGTRTTTGPDGLSSTASIGRDRTSHLLTQPDGTRITATLSRDPVLDSFYPSSTTITLPGGRTSSVTTSRTATLDTEGRVLTWAQSTQVGGGRTSTVSYDRAARRSISTSPLGRSVTTELDAQMRLSRVLAPRRAPAVVTYDAVGQPLSARQTVTRLDGTVITRELALGRDPRTGFVQTVTGPTSTARLEGFDEAGLASTVVGAVGTAQETRVALRRSAIGHVLGVAPPGAPEHTMAPDARDALASYTPPPIPGVDAAVTSVFDRDGLPLERLIGASGERVVYRRYPAEGSPTGSAGRLHQIVTGRGTFELTYDSETGYPFTATTPEGEGVELDWDGAQLQYERWSGPVSGTIRYTYSGAALRRTGIAIGGGSTFTYTIDDDGLITRVGALTLTWDSASADLTDTVAGMVRSQVETDSVDSVDGLGFGDLRRTSWTWPGGALVLDYAARDGSGRLTQRVETRDGVEGAAREYRYDGLGRLTDVLDAGVVTEHYGYDPRGNRIEWATPRGSGTATYDAQDRVESAGGLDYTYDDSGRVTRITDSGLGTSTTYEHDALGSLMAVTLPDGARIEYIVDAAGRRVGRRRGGALTHGWLYLDGGQIAAELDSAGRLRSQFVYATNSVVPDLMIRGGRTYRLITDQVGSVRLVVDTASGAVAQAIDYDAFGQVISDTSPGFTPFGFAGSQYDPDTGLVHMGAREYAPWLGRFLERDPILFAGGDTNLYAYCGSDPVNHIDPSGLVIDTLADGAFILHDLYTLYRDNIQGNCDNLGWNLLALGLDIVGALVPFMTGLGAGSRLIRSWDDILELLHRACSSGVCDAATRLCFAEGTLVATEDGPQPIERIAEGDLVWALDEDTGEWGYHPVVSTSVRDAPGVYALSFQRLDGATERIEATSEHPFYERERGWTRADALRPGDEVFTLDENWAIVTGSEWIDGERTVYNFEVEGAHTYFVGDEGLWVHNGYCSAAQLAANRVAGNAFRDLVARTFASRGFHVATEVFVSTPLGRRFVDVALFADAAAAHSRDLTRAIGFIETKVGQSVYHASQMARDAWIQGNLGIPTYLIRQ